MQRGSSGSADVSWDLNLGSSASYLGTLKTQITLLIIPIFLDHKKEPITALTLRAVMGLNEFHSRTQNTGAQQPKLL